MLLIDANKYLAFYQSEKISQFIEVLRNLREHVVVTQQIVDEVERNKASCFFRAVTDKLKMPKWTVPDHLLPAGDENDQLRQDVKAFTSSSEALRRRLSLHFDRLTDAVACSRDHISIELKSFFGTAITPTSEQLRRARYRKEVNNPPGKPNDPLGDQLNWEQFLDASDQASDIWVVSSDRDYFVKVGDELRLNPVLVRDLEDRMKRKSVNCFDTWSKAIPHFLKANNLSSSGLPSEECLADLESEERSLATAITTTTTTTTTTSTTTTPAPWCYSHPSQRPNQCPCCGSVDSFADSAYPRSQYGGLTLQYRCARCGHLFDTGDHWE